MTCAQIRQSFLDFFKSKEHTIVPSASLLPDSPNLLFTNAGMNQFVPIFLGQIECPYRPGRAADTQKCIRAGGKHNDLEDVGLDTYHHTFFEMLGNWSFGDYFKAEAIAWAWELVVDVWKFPPQRLYATIYQPDPAAGDPAERDEEAYNHWAERFRSVGLDPGIHIVDGGKQDNFWMMGETGPCGPCTEMHVDLRPGPRETSVEAQRSGAALVNGSDARCIEIWNNVFIQYNANSDGTFSPLPAKHVDTGMGFERVCSIIQGTRGLTDFENAKISNYETDVFRPIFAEIEKLTELNRTPQRYTSSLPDDSDLGGSKIRLDTDPDVRAMADQIQERMKRLDIDIAFRVIADHIRTLSFAIADGIPPGNNDRNYVLRRILRRAVRYGRKLGFTQPFLYKLIDVVAEHSGDVFPEVRMRKEAVKATVKLEEEAFNRTVDRGIRKFEVAASAYDLILSTLEFFEDEMSACHSATEKVDFLNSRPHFTKLASHLRDKLEFLRDATSRVSMDSKTLAELNTANLNLEPFRQGFVTLARNFEFLAGPDCNAVNSVEAIAENKGILALFDKTLAEWRSLTVIEGAFAFELYDTFGFPLDLTELMARERGLTVDTEGFEKLMEEQRARARAAQKKQIIALSEVETKEPTVFVGYDELTADAKVLEVVELKDQVAVVLDRSAAYAEMGGQVGDTGELVFGGEIYHIANTQKVGNTFLHFLAGPEAPVLGSTTRLIVNRPRRRAIERHHTVTHIFHWALHEVVSKEATQKGSYVGPDKLTFDFNSQALTQAQLGDIEKLVNERIVANDPVSWTDVPFAEAKANPHIVQLFGEKYGDLVRVVQIGGQENRLDGWSMELCGGTHTRHTGEIGLFRLVSEGAVAAGVRRVEAIAGLEAYTAARADSDLLKLVAGKVMAQGAADLEKKIESILDRQKALEKALKSAHQREAASKAKDLLATVENHVLIANLGDMDGDETMAISDALKPMFDGIVVLGSSRNGSVALIATVSKTHQSKIQAGKVIQAVAPIVGGKGGGKPDFARGGGKEVAKLPEALAEARRLISTALA